MDRYFGHFWRISISLLLQAGLAPSLSIGQSTDSFFEKEVEPLLAGSMSSVSLPGSPDQWLFDLEPRFRGCRRQQARQGGAGGQR